MVGGDDHSLLLLLLLQVLRMTQQDVRRGAQLDDWHEGGGDRGDVTRPRLHVQLAGEGEEHAAEGVGGRGWRRGQWQW